MLRGTVWHRCKRPRIDLDRIGVAWSGQVVIVILVFCAIQGAVSAYAIFGGGTPERIMGGMLLAATAAGLALEHPAGFDFYQVAIATLMVDSVLLAGMVAVALKANRYWTLWIAGIHATTLATHLVKLLNPQLLPAVYHLTAAISSFPVMCILVTATVRHRARARQHGTDPSWSDYFDPWTSLPLAVGQRH